MLPNGLSCFPADLRREVVPDHCTDREAIPPVYGVAIMRRFNLNPSTASETLAADHADEHAAADLGPEVPAQRSGRLKLAAFPWR